MESEITQNATVDQRSPSSQASANRMNVLRASLLLIIATGAMQTLHTQMKSRNVESYGECLSHQVMNSFSIE